MNDEQPYIDRWPMFEEAYSKFPVFADVALASVQLARKFNKFPPKQVEIDLAWKDHQNRARRHRAYRRCCSEAEGAGAAEVLKVSLSWLAKARMRGDGPPYIRIGRRYREEDLNQWMKGRRRLSTRE